MAKFLDWPFVCIFEDDAYPCKDCRQWLEDSLKDLPDDIECLVLGHCYILRLMSYSRMDMTIMYS